MENSTLRTVLQGSFLRFRSVSTKESYQINPLRTPERQKGLTLTLTKQALSLCFNCAGGKGCGRLSVSA
jgi:hypothetical protein